MENKTKRENLPQIGQVARDAGVKTGTIRFYERKGLINKPKRTESGYRIYSTKIVSQIIFIKNAQQFGFSLIEIKKLLEISSNVNERTCKQIQEHAKQKVKDMSNQIRELERMRSKLISLLQICKHCEIPNCCPILEAFTKKST